MGYIQDDWRFRLNLTLNIGLRYEATTRPTDSHTVPGYTVNGYTLATAGFQEIQTLVNCTPGTTACGPVGTSSPISNNPTTKNFEPRIGLSWDPRKDGKTAVRAGFGIFDVLPLPYEFGLILPPPHHFRSSAPKKPQLWALIHRTPTLISIASAFATA